LERRWGVLFQQGALFSSLTVKQNIQFPMRENLEISQRLMNEMAYAKLEMVGLSPRDGEKFPSELSGGMTKRVALARALALDPEIVFLDEPTSGLDPLMESVFQECILDATGEGRTVLLSSHILAEVEKLCDRVTIIRQGRAVQSGTLDDLRYLTRTNVTAATDRPVSGLDDLAGVHNIRFDDGHVHFDVDGAGLDAAIRHLSSFGIHSLVSQPPTLEELFLRHYGDELAAMNGDGAGASGGVG